jgi:hypothetical protein
MKNWIILCLGLITISCGSNPTESSNSSSNAYEDGRYCADIEYYYPETGTQSSYTLEVEIEDDELVKIYFPNGGWLDNSHFDVPDISSGSADFETDRGAEYKVRISGEGGCPYSSMDYPDEDEFERKELLKRRLLQQMEEEEDEENNTCPRCGAYEVGLYGDLCSSCQDEEDRENEDEDY